jgi:hypothetical protein
MVFLAVICASASASGCMVSPVHLKDDDKRFAIGSARSFRTPHEDGAITLAAAYGAVSESRRRRERASGNRDSLTFSAACSPRGVAQNRRQSQFRRSERAEGARIIAPRRKNSARLRRPWHATLRQSTWQRYGCPFPRCRSRSHDLPASQVLNCGALFSRSVREI